MKTLNQILNFAILILCVSAALLWGLKQRSEKLRFKDNFEAQVFKNGQQVFVTEMEYSRLYSEIDSLTKDLGKKPKHIIQVVQSSYIIKDTVTASLSGDTTFVLRNDTVFQVVDTLRFNIKRPCYNLSGWVYDGKIHENLFLKDKTSVVIYRERANKFLFVKYGRWHYSALFHSQCSKTIMDVETNIVIKKK
jgi:hypothetical protein